MSTQAMLAAVARKRAGGGPPSGYTLIASTSAPVGGAATITTSPAIDTTGATLIIANLGNWAGTGAGIITDSTGLNTWIELTPQNSGGTRDRFAYCVPVATSTTHTFSFSGQFGSMCVAAFSGASASPFDQENGANSAQTGSVTPSQNGELIVAGISDFQSGAVSVDSGFTMLEQEPTIGGVGFGSCIAYLIQGTAGAVNPTFSGAGIPTQPSSTIATFKAA